MVAARSVLRRARGAQGFQKTISLTKKKKRRKKERDGDGTEEKRGSRGEGDRFLNPRKGKKKKEGEGTIP